MKSVCIDTDETQSC